jgi:hypothetical protein
MGNSETALTIGKKYHIRNGFAKTLYELWCNQLRLEDIEGDGDPYVYIFRTESGEELAIDGGFLFEFSKARESERIYMYIESKEQN